MKSSWVVWIADLLRDWDYFTSIQHVTPELQAAAPVIADMLEDPARLRGAAREALRAIGGSAGQRWYVFPTRGTKRSLWFFRDKTYNRNETLTCLIGRKTRAIEAVPFVY